MAEVDDELIIYTIEEMLYRFANTYGFEDHKADVKELEAVLRGKMDDELYATTPFLFEDEFADIDFMGIKFHDEYRPLFRINGIKSTCSYTSKDLSFRTTNDGVCTISYQYKGKTFTSFPMSDYNCDIVSNYAFLHDVIFSYVLKMY
jgi:hypothetical protein